MSLGLARPSKGRNDRLLRERTINLALQHCGWFLISAPVGPPVTISPLVRIIRTFVKMFPSERTATARPCDQFSPRPILIRILNGDTFSPLSDRILNLKPSRVPLHLFPSRCELLEFDTYLFGV